MSRFIHSSNRDTGDLSKALQQALKRIEVLETMVPIVNVTVKTDGNGGVEYFGNGVSKAVLVGGRVACTIQSSVNDNPKIQLTQLNAYPSHLLSAVRLSPSHIEVGAGVDMAVTIFGFSLTVFA